MFQLVVATRNRNRELTRLLSSLESKANKDFLKKLIVVDQSEESIFLTNKSLLSKFIAENKSITVVHIQDKRKGLSKARNLGLQHIDAHGFLCFPDDDCWYPDSFFLEMVKRMEKYRSAMLVTYYREEEQERLSHKTDYKVNWLNLKRTPFSSVGIFLDLQVVKSEHIYFDENIGAGTDIPFAEDTLFCYRLFNEGYKINKISSPYVYHPVTRGEPNYYGSAYSQSYILLHKDLGFRFKALFLLSVLRTAIRSVFKDYDRVLLKGKLSLLKDKICKRES